MNLITTGLFCLFLTCILLKIFVPVLQRKKANQTILFYVKEHKHKNGTPTMGGVFFGLAIVVGYFLLGETSGIATVSLVFACAFFSVGFLDDFIKVKTAKNEGLKPYQKIIFQIWKNMLQKKIYHI
jgi:phospho-N-acetylmuramoyl-pentapeptide-transferase